jgi:hypothetical protein
MKYSEELCTRGTKASVEIEEITPVLDMTLFYGQVL